MEKGIFANMCMIEDGCGRVVVQKRTGTSWNGYACLLYTSRCV